MAANLPEVTSAELILVRKMDREGKKLGEVHAALGWRCTPTATRKRLARYGINISGRRLAHLGDQTSIHS